MIATHTVSAQLVAIRCAQTEAQLAWGHKVLKYNYVDQLSRSQPHLLTRAQLAELLPAVNAAVLGAVSYSAHTH